MVCIDVMVCFYPPDLQLQRLGGQGVERRPAVRSDDDAGGTTDIFQYMTYPEHVSDTQDITSRYHHTHLDID